MSAPTPGVEFKSNQHEFSEEQNRTISGLAHSMKAMATLSQLTGLVFAIFAGLQLSTAVSAGTGYGPPIGFAAAALFFLAIGFWTSGAAGSFQKVVETRNEDVWHLMNALRKLHSMYSLLRTIVLGTLVLAIVGIALVAFGMINRG